MKSKERNIGIGKKGARGKAQVQVIFDTDTFWLSQQRMAELFGMTQQDISYHLQQINDSGEIHLSDGYKKYLYGSEKWSDEAMYNLEVVIAVGYRVNSYEATQFRIWATNVLSARVRVHQPSAGRREGFNRIRKVPCHPGSRDNV